MGLYNSGFDVTGVDITDNHQYPFDFIKTDALTLGPEFLQSFDLIWASPPCQQYSWSTLCRRNKGKTYPDLVAQTSRLLEKTGRPFILENVVGAPVRNDVRLCGQMFGLRVVRHRIFEIHGFTVLQPPHQKHIMPVQSGRSYYMQVAGHGGESYSFKMKDWQKAMGIEWITKKEHLTQAIPPAYSKYLASFYCSS